MRDNIVEGTLSDENGREITPAQRQEIGPSAAQILAQLRASGLSLAEIAERTNVARRTLDDIQYGRSSGARIVPQLRPLYDALQRKRHDRRAINQVRDQARMQVATAQAPQLTELAHAVADMEIAAWVREQNEQLYQAALRYLGPAWQTQAIMLSSLPQWRQMVIQAAYEQREREQRALSAAAKRAANPHSSRGLFSRQRVPRIKAPTAPQRGQLRQIAQRTGTSVPYAPPASPLPRRALGDGAAIPDDSELPPWLR